MAARIYPLSKAKAAMAVVCPVCFAAIGAPCTGLGSSKLGHSGRHHALALPGKPEPDEATVLRLHETVGQREDARPFVAWMDGAHDFRLPGGQTMAPTRTVYMLETQVLAGAVRAALVDLAARHGLLVLAGDGRRGRYVVTERGREFYAAWQRGQVATASPEPKESLA